MIRIQVLFYFIFLWALEFEYSCLRLWRRGILFCLKFVFLRKALSFPFGHAWIIIGQDLFFFLIHEKAKWMQLLSLVIPQNLNGSLWTSVVTLTLYKGTEDHFWGPFKVYVLIQRYSEQKLISGQNQLKSWNWFYWNV